MRDEYSAVRDCLTGVGEYPELLRYLELDDAVDGSEILHQLRLVVYPIIYMFFYTFQVVLEFLNQHKVL